MILPPSEIGTGNAWGRLGGVTMARYGKKASQKVEKAMHERKRGTLKSGQSGK
jgi:hypothetical protein